MDSHLTLDHSTQNNGRVGMMAKTVVIRHVLLIVVGLTTIVNGWEPRIAITSAKHSLKEQRNERGVSRHRHGHCPRGRHGKRSGSRRSNVIQKGKSGETQKSPSPNGSEMKRAGEFNGDVRQLPNVKPVRQDLPRRADPKITPKPYPTPKIDKPNE